MSDYYELVQIIGAEAAAEVLKIEAQWDALDSISELGSDDVPFVKAPTRNDKDAT
jgi:hypothetical protein